MKKALFVFLALLIALPLFAGGKEEAAVEAKYQIGIVFDIAGRGDQSFNDSAYNGLVLLAEEFNGYIKDDPDKVDHGKEIEMKYLTPKPGGQDRDILLRSMAEDG